MGNWNTLADRETVEKAMAALKANGIEAHYVQSGAEAKALALSMIPAGAQVMTMTSTTNNAIGLTDEIEKSGKYKPVREMFKTTADASEKRRLGAGPDYAIGSVHAVSQDGHLLIASATGSQLPAYAYGGGKVIWIVGAQKIVKNMEDAWKRLHEHTVPLENERALKAYGVGTGVNKVLIINKEAQPGRLVLIFVDEVLGF